MGALADPPKDGVAGSLEWSLHTLQLVTGSDEATIADVGRVE
jgi:hypothetical protein